MRACPQAGVASPLPLLSLLFPPSKHVCTHTCAHTPVRPVCARRLPTEGWIFPHKPPRCLPPCTPRRKAGGPQSPGISAGSVAAAKCGRLPRLRVWLSRGARPQNRAACAEATWGGSEAPRAEGQRGSPTGGSAGRGCWSRGCTRVSPVQRGLPGHVVCGISPRAAGLWGNLRLPGHLLRLLAGVFRGPGGTGPLAWAAAPESSMASDKPGGFPPSGHV